MTSWIFFVCLFSFFTAHTTQFTQPGFHYLSHGEGSGRLMNGGSYVTFIDPKTKDFTIVIETMVSPLIVSTKVNIVEASIFALSTHM